MPEPLVLTTQGVHRSEVASRDARYRYVLRRRWGTGPVLPVFGCNPSYANGLKDDTTTRLWIDIASRWGYGGFDAGNPCALRSADPDALLTSPDPIGPDNERHIREIVALAGGGGRVFVGWGDSCPKAAAAFVMHVIRSTGAVPYALGLTKSGNPAHPLGFVRRLEAGARSSVLPKPLDELLGEVERV